MPIILRITDAGRAALVNAQRDGTAAVRIASAGVSPMAVAASPAATVLPGEVKRIATISGGATAADVIHLTVRDETADTYTVRSFALYLADGTLFAIYGQGDPIIEKSSAALLLLAIDATLVDVSAGQITFGDSNFMNPAATTETSGVVELATDAEAAALLDAVRALTPKGLAAVFTAANILARLVQVDGEGSGLDADLLDGRHGAWYADIPGRLGFTPVQQATGIGQLGNVVRIGWSGARLKLTIDNDDHGQFVLDKDIIDIWRASNDGAGSGLDADLLDGFHASAFAQLTGAAFTGPVSADGTIVAKSNLAAYAPINPRSFYAASQIIAGEPSRNPAFRTTLGYYLSGDQWRGVLNVIADGRGAPLDIQASGGLTTFGGPADIAGALTQGGAQVYHTGNDGAGSGLDADLLDGREGAWFADIAARLGYTPVQQGTGIGQLGNIVRIGWSGARLKATVDNTDHGPLVFDKDITDIWRASNDGAGSGLDADLLDGFHASAFARLTGAAFSGPVSADGTIVAKSNLASYAPVNPRSFDAASQIIAGEPSRNPAFHTTLGYYLSGDQWRGTLNAIADGKGAPLDIQASGGITTFGGPVDVSSALTQGGAQVYHTSNDGSGSGLDADLLDGREGAWFADIAARLGYTPIQQGTGVGQLGNIVRIGWSGARLKATVDNTDHGPIVFETQIADVWRASNDGAGSGLDADLLDGRDGAWFADIAARLGYTPIQQGTGVGQVGNIVRIGWSGSRLKATVDFTDQGPLVFDTHIADVWRASNDGAGSGLDADLLDGWQRDDIRRWANLLDVPGAFPPSAHSHGAADLAPAFASRLFATDGYQVLPGGLILQWCTGGMVSSGVESATFLSFPIVFPNACLQASVSTQLEVATTAGDAFYQIAGVPSVNGVTVQRQFTGGGRDERNSAARVFAIGF